jgi:hypothetical protein
MEETGVGTSGWRCWGHENAEEGVKPCTESAPKSTAAWSKCAREVAMRSLELPACWPHEASPSEDHVRAQTNRATEAPSAVRRSREEIHMPEVLRETRIGQALGLIQTNSRVTIVQGRQVRDETIRSAVLIEIDP